MGASCSMCGACCIGIRTTWDIPELERRLVQREQYQAKWDAYQRDGGEAPRPPAVDTGVEDTRRNMEFVSVRWHRITRREARSLRPVSTYKDDPKARFWSCDAFDPLTKQCTAHAERPPVCSGYPWYGKAPGVTTRSLDPECSYWHDLPREQWSAKADPPAQEVPE